MTVTATPSSASRSPLVEPEKTSSEKPLSSSPQPFTDVLTEATSKVLRDVLDKPEVLGTLHQKGESTKAIPFRNGKEERAGSSPKKSVVVDISTQVVPVIVASIPLTITQTAPVGALAIAHVAKESTSQQPQIGTVANNEAQDSQSSSMMKVDATKHPSSDHLESKEFELSIPTPVLSTHLIVHEDLDPKVITNVESDRVDIAQAKIAQAVASLVTSSILTTRPTNSVGNLVFAPEVHISSPVAIGTTQDVKSVRTREPSIRVSAKTVEPMSEHVSPILIRTQLEVVPVWPSQSPVVASAVNTVTAPLHIAQPSPHSLDVGALAGAISRPLDEARGGYTVMIAMHPVELGHLQAVVTLRGSDLHVLITAQTHVGHEALAHAVETLKTELSRDGINVNVTLQDHGSQPRGGERTLTTAVPREVFSEEESVSIASALPIFSANQINLVL